MTRCPACGRDVPDSSRYCPDCAAPLAVAITFATRTVAAAPTPAPVTLSSSAAAPSPHGRFIPGTLISGRYRIVSILGKGGMGEVYRADDLTLGQSVALKFLPESLSNNVDAVNRFRNEVRIARQVSHPNVCRVHDVGEVEGQLFLSMEYVDGEDLASLLRRIGRLPEDKAVEIARKLCAGLAAAHEKGVLHRDLKPGNVMLDARGQVLLTDFGLAGIADAITGSEVRSGTPAYMSPEQLEGREVTVRSDIYALGLVLYELFTGKRPFDGNSLPELLAAQRANTPLSISSMVRDLDPSVERVIVRCLDPEPARRPASAISVAAALPGGDPLAAALAAGETPSPDMVAAAGEDVALRPVVAIPLAAAMLIAIGVHGWVSARESMLEKVRPTLSPEVLRHTAHNIARTAGYGDRYGWVDGFSWSDNFIGFVGEKDKPAPNWNEIARERPPLLRYWYRESMESLSGMEFHDQLLTLGNATEGDPPPTIAGMIHVALDHRGHLLEFRSMPAQKLDEPATASMPDWTPMFRAAGLDPAQLTEAAPMWNFLESSDMRIAWTGKWPDTDRELRVEAAAFNGKPVVFSVLGPWSPTRRHPSTGGTTDFKLMLVVAMLLTVLGASVWLARQNLERGRGDRRGAMHLAAAMFVVMFVLWSTRHHFVMSDGLLGYLLVEMMLASAFALMVWTIYLAAEPFVRRYWPTTLIAWTRVLSGRFRDGIVGRDILVGAAVSCAWRIMFDINRLWSPNQVPNLSSVDSLISLRAAISEVVENVPQTIAVTLIMFVSIFLLRLLLRRDWLAGAAFAGLFLAAAAFAGSSWRDLLFTAVVYGSMALVTIRFGLLSLAALLVMDGLIGDMPASFDSSAWYYPTFIAYMLLGMAIVLWSFRQSMRRDKTTS